MTGIVLPGEEASDDQLVRAAQLRCRRSSTLSPLCQRRVPVLLSPAQLGADAADATSAIFTRALANIGDCQAQSFRPWLFTIARNVVTDHYRAARPVETLDESIEVTDEAVGPEELAIAGDERQSLTAALRQLTDEQRSIIELRLAGLSANEIAAALGKSRNAIDQMQYRAVARLRKLLAVPVLQMEEAR